MERGEKEGRVRKENRKSSRGSKGRRRRKWWKNGNVAVTLNTRYMYQC